MDHKIWKTGEELSRQGRAFCLVMIVETSGSVPRRPGAVMLVRDDGSTIGTIGGAKIERIAAREALETIKSGKAITGKMILEDEEDTGSGAICGGTMTLFYQPESARSTLHLFGAGHVAIPTAKLAASVGYSVKVYDEDDKYANPERFPDASAFITGDLEQIMARAQPEPKDAVVVLTGSHKTDLDIVMAFRGRMPAYFGVIGSKRKAAHYKTRLKEEGWTKDEIDFVHVPIGLSIEARTPEEIAVSIVAEMISLRGPVE